MPQNVHMSLKHRMNYLIERQGVVSGNIANASTPGYLAKDISFEKLVQSNGMKMSKTSGAHLTGKITGGDHKMTTSTDGIRHDGNSVKMDTEMLKLQEIQMHYRLATQLYKKQVGFQKMALGRSQ
ncbi:MAG: flagellar basal-body rod protein FlgB [Alphaproteobacteria bacterium]|jgi:flagellar basal-body rod protein FlgB